MYDGDRVAILIDGDDSPTVVDGVFAPRERIKIVSDVVPSTSQVGRKYIQCPLDIATDLRQGGSGRYRQRGRYIKGLLL